MASHSSQQAQQWDLESAFGIGNPDRWGDFTCVGFGLSKHRRCRNRIAAHNQNAAREILHQLSCMHPLDVSDTQTDKLQEAAGYALCRHYHQNQADEVVRKWKKILREEASRQPEWRWAESSEEGVANQSHRHSASRGYPSTATLVTSSSTSSSTRSRFGSQEPRQRNSRHNGVNDGPRHVIDDMGDLRTMMSDRMEMMHEPQRQAPSSLAGVEEEQQLPSAWAPELQQQSVSESARQQTCSVTHVLRRSIDENCVICTMPMVNCSLSELVWCKSSCGQSVHRNCFAIMRGYVDVTLCVLCRADWADDCRHDEQCPQKFEMWADWEWGLDLLFDQSV